uniref:Uncharacterized protein n=1 Tax=Brassica oleracea TaxID=3712 RepID=A0A3P6G9J6_BRAOL|nr:unnamed protein product [Brassica oleracea]
MSLAPLPTLTGDVVVSASGVSVSSTAASVPPPTSRQPSFDSPPYSSFVCLISLPQPSFVFSSFLNLVNTSLRCLRPLFVISSLTSPFTNLDLKKKCETKIFEIRR